MPTLYVENVPTDLYEALRAKAKAHNKSIAAEVLDLLRQEVPTQTELERRKAQFQKYLRLVETRVPPPGDFQDSVSMIREDRER